MADRKTIFTKEQIQAATQENPFLKMNDLVYQLLGDAILSAQLAPGEKLNATNLSKELGVSITPVRNAIKRLIDEGYVVEDEENKAYYVFNISDRRLEQIYDARRMFEGHAAYICAQRHAVINLKALKYMAEEFRDLWLRSLNGHATAESRKRRAEIDQEFHNLIIQSTENEFIIEYYQALKKEQIHALLRAVDFWDQDSNVDNKMVLAGQHISIYTAIAGGLPDMARALAEEHMDFCKYRSLLNRRRI